MMQIEKVKNNSKLREFIQFPLQLYKNDKYYIHNLYSSQKKQFSIKRNPFFEHSFVNLYLCRNNGKTLGRIAAIYNSIHNKIYKENSGFFGFFESINDYEVTAKLLDHVEREFKYYGFNSMIGPENFTTNNSCGILIDGFTQLPNVQMPYNKEYYADFFERYGFQKLTDLYSYALIADEFPERIKAVAEKLEHKLWKRGFTFRTLNYRRFKNEIKKLREIYNRANKNNWGFIPLNESEFQYMATDLKKIVPEDLALVAAKDDEIIGFLITVPNINQIISHLKRGWLFPTGIFKLIFLKSKIDSARITILGIDEKFRNIGIDICLYNRVYQAVKKLNMKSVEASFVMENNNIMRCILEKLNFKPTKSYRIYQYCLQ